MRELLLRPEIRKYFISTQAYIFIYILAYVYYNKFTNDTSQQSYVINEIREKKVNNGEVTNCARANATILYLLYLDIWWAFVCK